MSIGRLGAGDTAIQPTIFDAKADLLTATAADTPARLAVGANGTLLTADSSEATGLKWVAPAGGGKVLQVVEGTTTTQVTNSTSTYADTGLSATITPSAATSKILVMVSQNGCQKSAGNDQSMIVLRLLRGATQIGNEAVAFYSNSLLIMNGGLSYLKLDDPNTTSATTYKTQFKNFANAAEVRVQASTGQSTIILMEIGA